MGYGVISSINKYIFGHSFFTISLTQLGPTCINFSICIQAHNHLCYSTGFLWYNKAVRKYKKKSIVSLYASFNRPEI